MSKYIKQDDVFELVRNGVLISNGNFESVCKHIGSLPTIEVSEEVLKAAKKFNAYTIADENAEMGMRTQIEPIIEVSEDCISRKWLEEHKDVISYTNEWHETEIDEFVSWENIENAPSVVPSTVALENIANELKNIREILEKQYRAEGEWLYIDEPIVGNPYGRYRCSECEMEKPHKTDYCPNCGAKMRLE